MKKLVSLSVAVLLVVAMSVCSFAADYALKNEPMFYEKGGDTYVGTLVTSALTEAQKDFMRAWLKSDTNAMFYTRNASLEHGIIGFYIFSSDTVLVSAATSSTDSDWGTLKFKNGFKYSLVSV